MHIPYMYLTHGRRNTTPLPFTREREVYAGMPGYDATMKDSSDVFGLREPEIMPDGLMGDKVRVRRAGCLPV